MPIHELLNLIGTEAPPDPSLGDLYTDICTNKIYSWTGTSWVEMEMIPDLNPEQNPTTDKRRKHCNCPRCGAPLPLYKDYCLYCGTPIEYE